jgi:hypothetical protein
MQLSEEAKVIWNKSLEKYYEGLSAKIAEEIEKEYQEYIKHNPKPTEPEWILHLTKKYGRETEKH